MPLADRSRRLLVAAAVLPALALSACGGGGSDAAPAQPTTPTSSEYTAWQTSTEGDAKKLGEAVFAAYQKDKTFPASAKGLGALSAGNRVGSYDKDARHADVCVEHVRQGKAWIATTYYVGVDRVDVASRVKNIGC